MITRKHLLQLERTPAPLQWKRIAYRLPDLSGRGEAYAFTDVDIEDIRRKNESNSKDCLLAVIRKWTDMSSLHTAGLLYDVLREVDCGRAAEEVFGQLSPGENVP